MKKNLVHVTLASATVITHSLISCSAPDPSAAPVINTPIGAKVDLAQVHMIVNNPQITRINENKYSLSFDYTLINKAGANISFLCLYNTTDSLVQVNLTDKTGQALHLGKRPLEGLTMAQPKPMHIPIGKTTRRYTVPVMPELREKGELIKLRVRIHAPSRYDELRSSVEAPTLEIPWP